MNIKPATTLSQTRNQETFAVQTADVAKLLMPWAVVEDAKFKNTAFTELSSVLFFKLSFPAFSVHS